MAVIIRYTKLALADLRAAREYLQLHNPKAAAEVADRIRTGVAGLRQFPERGRPGLIPGTRELVIPRTPFMVPYQVVGREIHVLAVVHDRRAWPSEA